MDQFLQTIHKTRVKKKAGAVCLSCNRDVSRRYAAKYKNHNFVYQEKKCPACGHTKPYKEFAKNSNSKSGLQAYCKECFSDYSKNGFEKFRRHGSKKVCRSCRIERDVGEFLEDRRTKDGLKYDCNVCERDKREVNKDKWNKYNRDRFAKSEKAKEDSRRQSLNYLARKRNAEGTITEEVYQRLKKAHDRCVYCGSGEDLTIEHLIPLSKGGSNKIVNLALACRSCNSAKSDRTPLEFTIFLLDDQAA